MKTQPAYPAARAAALRVHRHYSHHAGAIGSSVLPDLQTIETMVSVAFWASLRKEEIYTPKISLAFTPPELIERPLMLERTVPLESQPLTRLGPAVERPGIHLCVWHKDGDLSVWGAARNLPPFCFVLEVVAPGLLVIKRSRGDNSGKFVNVAVLQGDEIKVIDQELATVPDYPELLVSLLGLQPHVEESESALIQLAVSMREHGRGGSLLVVPAGGSLWLESVLQPIAYSIAPPFRALLDLMREDPAERMRKGWQEKLRRAIDGIAGLTAVNGATIITDEYEVLAFGAKIVRRKRCEQVDRVIVTEPVEGSSPEVTEPGQLGGTRHFSAAQFAHDQRDAIALVASQDGRFTVFGWSPAEQMVHAHRIEALLL